MAVVGREKKPLTTEQLKTMKKAPNISILTFEERCSSVSIQTCTPLDNSCRKR